jgi:Tol biopolymer transport system component
VSWHPDGSYVYVNATSRDAFWAILSIDMAGRTKVLTSSKSDWLHDPVVSPDGRHLVFSDREYESNVFMLENF